MERSISHGEEHKRRGENTALGGVYYTEGSIVHEESRSQGEEHITQGGTYYTGRSILHGEEHTTREVYTYDTTRGKRHSYYSYTGRSSLTTRGGRYYIEEITLYEERNAEKITPNVEGAHLLYGV